MLKGVGVAMALPWLESMTPGVSKKLWANSDPAKPPKRMLAICNNLGVFPKHFFPTESGAEYKLSPYLEEIAAYRSDFTIFSGVSHPHVDGGHSSDNSFLTAAPDPSGSGFRNTLSLDQFIAEKIGHHTRFPSLTLGVNVKEGRRSLSWTRSGALIPCEDKASEVYKKLFLQGSEEEIERQMVKLRFGESIMDTIADQSRALHLRLGKTDRERMDQYTTAVREVEQRMAKSREWEHIPKPKPSVTMPVDPDSYAEYVDKTRLMYQMARLAFETDSTRSISLFLDSTNSPTIYVDGVEITDSYHNLSHHGLNEQKLAQLQAIDRVHMQLLGELFGDLKNTQEGDGTLLNNTMVMYGSNLGDANKHTTDNMPILLAGGGFKHGRHISFNRKNNYPLPNLFVSMIQEMGIGMDRFASSTGTMTGLERV